MEDSGSPQEVAAAGTTCALFSAKEIPQMEETLLELLCAPLSHGALRLASSTELGQINQGIQERLIRNRDGALLEMELDGSLVCESEKTCYPIRDGLPVLLPGEAFDWPQNT